jgi:DNA-binding beta-propeller fold protein YncE
MRVANLRLTKSTRAALCLAAALIALLTVASSASATDRIYWSNYFGGGGPGSISWANLDGSGSGDVNTSGASMDGPMGMAIDTLTGRVYWANFGGSGQGTTIAYANLDGSGGGTLPIPSSLVVSPHGLAIDSAAGKIYWPNFGNSTIGVANVDGSGAHLLQTPGAVVDGPRGLAVDTTMNRLYWANWANNTLFWENLDSSGGGQLNTGGATIDGTEGVAVDHTHGKLFFGDFQDPPGPGTPPPRIAFANLDGSGGGNVDTSPITPNDPHGVAVDPEAGKIYWADFYGPGLSPIGTISSANISGGGGANLPTGSANGGTGPDGANLPVLLKGPVSKGNAKIKGDARPGSTLECRPNFAADLAGAGLYRAPQSYQFAWSAKGRATGKTSKSLKAKAVAEYRCGVTASNAAGEASQTSRAFAIFKLGGEKLNPDKGTAKLKVRVPGPGRLTLRGKGLVKERPSGLARVGAELGRKVKGGKVRLLVKAKGKAEKRLLRHGRAKIKGTITFTPSGGDPSTQTKRLKLKERR